MLDYQKLAELLFPHVSALPEDIEAAFPKRELPEGAKVTRFAPSPTGFVHFGGLFPTTVAERLAHQSGGVLYLRIEDTDAKREVPGAAEGLIKTLATYGLKEFKAKLPESVRVREKLITAPMVEKYGKEGYRNMVVPADATVTPLAAETADALKVGILKKL